MAAVRLRLGGACALFCVAGVLWGYFSKFPVVAASEPTVLAVAGGDASASGISQQGRREVSLKSASSSALKSATGTEETASVAVDGSSDHARPTLREQRRFRFR